MKKPIIFTFRKRGSERIRCVNGLPIFSESRARCEKQLRRLLTAPAPRSSRPCLIFTPNLEMLAKAKHDKKAYLLLRSADLLLPDGIGVRIASGFRVKERLPGIEIGEFLLSLAAERGLRVFLLGGRSGIAECAAARLKERFPALSVVGTHDGYFGKDEERTITDTIRAAETDILFVCMGFPRQEEFLVRNRTALSGVRMALGLGGSLDCWSGNAKRAPDWMQKCGFEWLYRVIREPSRIPRLLRSVRDFFMW